MFRNANLTDLDFVCALVLDEAKNGHFNRELLLPAAARGWRAQLESILKTKRKTDGSTAYVLVWQFNGEAIGFVIMSSGPDNKGNEFWMAAIQPKFRGKGEGEKMVAALVANFRGKNLVLVARCSPESEAMYQILLKNDFTEIAIGETGSRGLLFQG